MKSATCLDQVALKNEGTLLTTGTFTHRSGNIFNTGQWEHEGNLTTALIQGQGTIIWRNGTWTPDKAEQVAVWKWHLENMNSPTVLTIHNYEILQMKNCTLIFDQIVNHTGIVLNGGKYTVKTAFQKPAKITLLDADRWVFINHPNCTAPHFLSVPDKGLSPQSKLEVVGNLFYDYPIMVDSLTVQGNLEFQTTCSFLNPIDIAKISTTGAAKFYTSSLDFTGHHEIVKIAHLILEVYGSCTVKTVLKAPALTLDVKGPVTVGVSNDSLGTIAATSGDLNITAHSIDGKYGKIYGKGKVTLLTNKDNIVIGTPAAGMDVQTKQNYYASISGQWWGFGAVQNAWAVTNASNGNLNGAYVASDDILTLRSQAEILVDCGILSGTNGINVHANNTSNTAGKIMSRGPITFSGGTYLHAVRPISAGSYSGGSGSWCQCPTSGPALLESLGDIQFNVSKITNRASTIRAGGKFIINNTTAPNKAAMSNYVEEPVHCYLRYHNDYGVGCYWGWQQPLMFTMSCMLQSGDSIQLNLGGFTITGSMSAPTITIQANTGSFVNSSRTRQTSIATKPIVIDVTSYLQNTAKSPGILALQPNGSVTSEFPLGSPSLPGPNQSVQFGSAPSINLSSIFNPLSSLNLDMHIQALLSDVAGKVYTRNARGKNLSSALWGNTQRWKEKTSKSVMTQNDLESISEAMLLYTLTQVGSLVQQQTLLCLPPVENNPYRDSGDIAADTFSCTTEGDQTHLNNRIVATQDLSLKSTNGSIKLETQSYTVIHSTKESKTVQQIAMPQQQLISTEGNVSISSSGDISRTGTLVAAAGNVSETSEHGSVLKQPLILQTYTETRHESHGLFSSSITTTSSLTHTSVATDTHAGNHLKEKANDRIQQTGTTDVAGESIEYTAPFIQIDGLLLKDRHDRSSESDGPFSSLSSSSSQETAFAQPASISAPKVTFTGKEATLAGVAVRANELIDDTEAGIKFIAKVTELLCSAQSINESPFLHADVGFKAGYETMIPTMLLVEKVIRRADTGEMLLQSVHWDKNKTQIIGKFVETTYHLKSWQVSWAHIEQLIPDEALVVIALAVGIATQGLGVELLAPLLNGVTAATGMTLSATGVIMVNAGVSAICATASTSFLKHGDPIQVVKDLTSVNSLKSVAFSMASAGLCAKLGSLLKVDMKPGIKTLLGHAKEQALRGTVDAMLNVAVSGKDMASSIKQIPLKTILAYVTNQLISLDDIGRSVASAAIGAANGFVTDGNRKAMIAGATGALTAELVGSYLIADTTEICDSVMDKISNPEDIPHVISAEVQKKADLAKIIAGGVAAVSGQNPSIAINSASVIVDNDIIHRGELYAQREFLAMLNAVSQAMVTIRMELVNNDKSSKPAKKAVVESAKDDSDITMLLTKPPAGCFEDILNLVQANQEKSTADEKPSLADKIINGGGRLEELQRKTAPIIREIVKEAVNKALDDFSMIPNPLGAACYAATVGRDLSSGKTTVGEILFNAAATYGVLKGIKLVGQGIKFVYQSGKSLIMQIPDVISLARYKNAGHVPFVNNPKAGQWTNATVADDLMITDSFMYEMAYAKWAKDPKGVFNVVGHGNPKSILVNTQSIHPRALSQENLRELQLFGEVELNAVQLARLIRTAPGYVKGTPVNLFSCSTGAEADGLAQQLANRMNIPVSAFTKILGLTEDGVIKTFSKETGELGVMKVFHPQVGWEAHIVPLTVVPTVLLMDTNEPDPEPIITNIAQASK